MEQVITGLSGDEVPVESVITNLLHSVRKAEMIRERRVHTQLVNVVYQQTAEPYAINHTKTQGSTLRNYSRYIVAFPSLSLVDEIG